MNKLNTKIKEKPIIATLLIAVIIGLICLNIYIVKYYQPETEFPPNLVLRTDSGEEIELLLLGYNWTYKGEQKIYNSNEDVVTLTTHNFDGKSTIFKKFKFSIDYLKIYTEPSYKAQGFSVNSLLYNKENGYVSSNGTNVNRLGKTAFTYYPNINTSVATFTLFSEKQGTAVYGLKIVNPYYSDLTEVKEIKNLELDKEEISKFVENETFGRFLKDVQIEKQKVILTYNYFVSNEFTLVLANSLFALIDDLNEVEFRFDFDKYVKNTQDQITYNITKTELDSIEPIIYNRDRFKDTSLDLKLDELRAYIGK